MSFEMEKDGHQIEMTEDRVWGIEIVDLKCPYERQCSAIQAEIITYHSRDNKESLAWVTIELIEKVLDGSYFKEEKEKNEST